MFVLWPLLSPWEEPPPQYRFDRCVAGPLSWSDLSSGGTQLGDHVSTLRVFVVVSLTVRHDRFITTDPS